MVSVLRSYRLCIKLEMSLTMVVDAFTYSDGEQPHMSRKFDAVIASLWKSPNPLLNVSWVEAFDICSKGSLGTTVLIFFFLGFGMIWG